MIIKNARIYTPEHTFKTGDLTIRDGRIAFGAPPLEGEEVLDANGAYALPGLVDIHFHGAVGHDFCDADEAGLQAIADFEASKGVLAICPATMTFSEEILNGIMDVAAAHKNGQGADLVGINMEGPYISPKKIGAQNPKYVQGADAATIDQLTQAVTKAQNLKTVGGCSVLLSETTLRAHARSMSKQISNIKEQAKAVTAAATAVAASKRALEVNKTTAALQKTIADAKTLLDGSAGQVADESTRDALAKAIDAAQKLLDGKSTDVTAMQNASKVISSTSDGVNKSVAEQTAANAQSNTNSNTNNGTTNRRYTYTWQFGPSTSGVTPQPDSGKDDTGKKPDTGVTPQPDSGKDDTGSQN